MAHFILSLLLLVVCIVGVGTGIVCSVEERYVSFKQFGHTYPVNGNEIATFLFEDGRGPDGVKNLYFRGYLEIYFAQDTAMMGKRYSISELIPRWGPGPPIVKSEHLKLQRIFTVDLTQISLPSHIKENITIRVYPQFKINIDPYSVRAYNYQSDTFTPLFPASDSESPTLGPWEFTFAADQYIKSVFNFQVFARYDDEVDYGKVETVMYPRYILYAGQHHLDLVLRYETVRVLPPNTLDKPSVQVIKNYNPSMSAPDNYIAIENYMITQHKLKGKFQILTIEYPINLFGKIIDPESLKCAYSFSKNFLIDENSIVTMRTQGGYELYCSPNLGRETFLLVIIGKEENTEDNCYQGELCEIIPTSKTDLVLKSANVYPSMYLKAQTQLVGNFKLYLNDLQSLDKLSKMDKSVTKQSLTLVNAFTLDFSNTFLNMSVPTIQDSKQNFANLIINPTSQTNVDPFSLRVFLLNDGKLDILSEDVPSLTAHLDLDIARFIGNNVTLALFNFQETGSHIGDVVDIYYSRNVIFQISAESSLNMHFKEVYHEFIPSFKRPYFTISLYKPLQVRNIRDYIILHGFMQQNGNGLENYAFDKGREFTFSKKTTFKNPLGNDIPVDFLEMRCAYLFKETDFEVLEFSPSVPSMNGDYFTIDCEEDISDESFVFLIVAKPLEIQIEKQLFNTPYPLKPRTIGSYDVLSIPDDGISIIVNPFTKLKGNYTLTNELTNQYVGYKNPYTDTPPDMVAVYQFDPDRIILEENQNVSLVTIEYMMKATRLNLDPYSYKFMTVDDHSKELKCINCSTEPYNQFWKMEMTISNLEKVKIAVLVYLNSKGAFGQSYSLHYERSLSYNLEDTNQQLFLKFSSGSFPSPKIHVNFVLEKGEEIKSMNDSSLVVVNSFVVVQDINTDILTIRQFHFTKGLKDSYGNTIENLHSIQCIYTAPGKIIYGNAKLSSNENSFVLECSEIIALERYNWLIVTRSNPVTPIPSIRVEYLQDYGVAIALGSITIILTLAILLLISFIVIYVKVLKNKPHSIVREEQLMTIQHSHYHALQ